MITVESRLDGLEGDESGHDGDDTIGADYGGGYNRRSRRVKEEALPLTLGAMGQLTKPESCLFDDKLTNQASFGFDGQKGGLAWKTKLGNYFISKCPALKQILAWAERYNGETISFELLEKATFGTAMTADLLESANGQLWGFMSNAVSAEADTIFKGADDLNGFDAWRRLIRYITHGASIKLEMMRTEMKHSYAKPIKNVETVAIGIAEFELRYKEYGEAGGTLPTDQGQKADLPNILPAELREGLLWRATDPGSFARFRDMVRPQAARSLLSRRRLPLHNVGDERAPRREEPEDSDSDTDPEQMSRDDLIAFFKKGNVRGQDRTRGRQPQRDRGAKPDRERGPRKCANCGKEHKELKCPHPQVDVKDRPCWKCGENNHMARDCKKNLSAVTTPAKVLSAVTNGLHRLCAVDYGFSLPRRPVEPTAQVRTLGSLMHPNVWEALGDTAVAPEVALDEETDTIRPSIQKKA